jgi:hypothetical protein
MGFFSRLFTGNQLVSSLVAGKYDESPAGQQLAAWFKERPAREEQRELFVQISLGIRSSSGVIADRLMHCIMEVWGGKDAQFGDMLAQEIDHMIIFDPPKDAQQVEYQRIAKQKLANLKTRLRALDAV